MTREEVELLKEKILFDIEILVLKASYATTGFMGFNVFDQPNKSLADQPVTLDLTADVL